MHIDIHLHLISNLAFLALTMAHLITLSRRVVQSHKLPDSILFYFFYRAKTHKSIRNLIEDSCNIFLCVSRCSWRRIFSKRSEVLDTCAMIANDAPSEANEIVCSLIVYLKWIWIQVHRCSTAVTFTKAGGYPGCLQTRSNYSRLRSIIVTYSLCACLWMVAGCWRTQENSSKHLEPPMLTTNAQPCLPLIIELKKISSWMCLLLFLKLCSKQYILNLIYIKWRRFHVSYKYFVEQLCWTHPWLLQPIKQETVCSTSKRLLQSRKGH